MIKLKLTDLNPVWLTPDVFTFKSPIGFGDYIICKRIPLSARQQMKLFISSPVPNKQEQSMVPANADFCWKFEGNDFETLTVTPSIDYNSSRNWHGFITEGNLITV